MKRQNRTSSFTFHINTVPVDKLQMCVLLLVCENYILSLITLKSLTSVSYVLIPWSRIVLWKLTDFQLVSKFSAFYGTRQFINTFTSACHLSLSWTRLIQSMHTKSTYWKYIVILFPVYDSVFLSGLFPSGFPTKTQYTPLLFTHSLHAPHIQFFSISSTENC